MGRQIAQHEGHAGFIEILGVVGSHPHTHCARPILDHGQLVSQVSQDVGCALRVMIGDVQKAKAGLRRMARQSHLGTELRNDQACCHQPLGVSGMTKGKQIHTDQLADFGTACDAGLAGFLARVLRVFAVLALVFLAALGLSLRACAATSLTAAAAMF